MFLHCVIYPRVSLVHVFWGWGDGTEKRGKHAAGFLFDICVLTKICK